MERRIVSNPRPLRGFSSRLAKQVLYSKSRGGCHYAVHKDRLRLHLLQEESETNLQTLKVMQAQYQQLLLMKQPQETSFTPTPAFKHKIAAVQAEAAVLKAKLKELQEKLDQSQHELTTSENLALTYKARISGLQEELDNSKILLAREMRDMKAAVSGLARENRSLTEFRKSAEDQANSQLVPALQNHITSLQEERWGFTSQIETLQSELNEAKTTNTNLSSLNDRLTAQVEAYKSTHRDAGRMQQTLDEVREKLAESSAESKMLQSLLEDTKQRADAKASELASFQDKVGSYQGLQLQYEQSEANYSALQSAMRQLEQSNRLLRLDKESLEAHIEELQGETKTLSSKLDDQTKVVIALKEDKLCLEKEKNILQEKVIEVENYFKTEAGKMTARLERELAETKLGFVQAEADMDELEYENTCLQQELKESQDRVDFLESQQENFDRASLNRSNSKKQNSALKKSRFKFTPGGVSTPKNSSRIDEGTGTKKKTIFRRKLFNSTAK